MGINTSFISNKKSKEVINNSPKLPLATDLADGEIAVNFAKDYETLAIKNESGDVVTFSSDNKFYKKSETSGNTEIQTALGNKQDTLVSGSNIKTINNTSILGSGNITIEGGFIELVNPSADTKVGLVNKLSQYYDTNIGKGAVIEGDGYEYNGNTYNIVASGSNSHAEGRATKASGDYSHTEGWGTQASGINSHAEGSYTQAIGDYSHAEGNGTKANGQYSHAEGNNTKAIGLRSHAEGDGTQAIGISSHAEGQSTTASGNESHAEGASTTANGSYSHAEGQSTTASGSSSHAEGGNTKANGDYSHAEGYGTIAKGNSSHAEGSYTTASGSYSHAEGIYTTASGLYSHAEGKNGATANGEASHAEGCTTTANGEASHAEGYTTTANGNSSHAEGSSTKASSSNSHAEGYKTTASGESSHAEGFSTTASGYYSHAEGQTTVASSWSSHAEGNGTQANGESSHAEGLYTIANNNSEHASGQYNVSSSASTTFGNSGNTLFSVGNGTSDNARNNAFEIRQNGDIYITSGGTDIKLQDHLGGSGSQIQSDWNESDITSDAYIKNRPFYGSIGYTAIYNETINCVQNGPTHGGINFTPTEELIVGKTYKVTIDSDEYVVKAVSPTALNLNENWSTPFNDTWSIFKSGNYYSICINGAIGQTKSVKIEKQYLIVEKQIESEYVDLSNYYNKTECDNKYLTAQTQSDWNQNNKYSASFIKNKPFGVETYVKSEKVYEGTFNRSTYSSEEFKQVYWDGNISTNILSVGDYIRLVINGEDRGDYTKVVSNAGTTWRINYVDSANGYSLYPNYNNTNAQLNFYGVNATPATNLPSGDTISVEIWKCALGETKLDNKYVDYENSSYIKAIENSIPKIWTGTQSEYDALTTKDSSTIYFIK